MLYEKNFFNEVYIASNQISSHVKKIYNLFAYGLGSFYIISQYLLNKLLIFFIWRQVSDEML